MSPPKAASVAVADDVAATSAKPTHTIIRLINRVRVEVVDALERELAPYDLTAPQLMVLSSVANREADSAAAICKSISYDPGAMTRMIDRLEQKGLIRRAPHPEDRRATTLELTADGLALYPKLLAAKDVVQNQFLRGFSADEARMLDGLLNRMVENR
jgi:DNA-binding MarR family transcriptional regulator